MQPRVPTFRNRHRGITTGLTIEKRTQALSSQSCRHASGAGKIEDRRDDVDAANLLGDDAGLDTWRRYDQRHFQCGVVEKEPVIRFAVAAEPLAVIRGHDDSRACQIE